MRRAIVICALAVAGCGGDDLPFDANGCPLMDGRSARVEWVPSPDIPMPPKSLRFAATPSGVGGQGYAVIDDAMREGRGLISSDCALQLDLPSASLDVGVFAAWSRDHWAGSTNPGRIPVTLYP